MELSTLITFFLLCLLVLCVYILFKKHEKFIPHASSGGLLLSVLLLFHMSLSTAESKERKFEDLELRRNIIQSLLDNARCVNNTVIIDFNLELMRLQKDFQRDPFYRMYHDERVMNLKPIN